MVSLMSLAVPIVVAAVLVFIVSSIVHMALPYHKSDFNKLPNEGEVLDTFRRLGVREGDYVAPYANSSESMKDPAYLEQIKKGPGLVLTVWKGQVNMGELLGQWFVFLLVVSFFTAYVLSRVFAPGADYLEVFRIAGTVAFMGYALGGMPASIWYKKSWSTTLKSTFDGLLYGLITAGTFGWLWPR